MTPQQKLFLVGAAGAVSVEVVRWYLLVSNRMRSSFSNSKKNPFPQPQIPWYGWLFYFVLTLAMALMGGGLAILYKPQMLLGAFHIGVSTSIIILSAAHKLPKVKL